MKSTHRIKIRGFHLDLYGHVNNARYLELMEEARWVYFEEMVDYSLFQERGWAFVIVNYNINYRYPATIGDFLRIETSLKHAGNKSVVMHQELYLNETDRLVVDADVTFVIMDQKTQRAIPIEGELRDMLVQVTAKEA